LTIASTSKNKDAAFQVIALYFSDEVQTAIARTASLVSGSNVPEIVKQYGADTPANALICSIGDWRGQSRASPMPQRRRGVPCRRLIRDSAGPAALALMNQMARKPSGDGSRSSQGYTVNAPVRRLLREEERRSQFSDSG
jgi:hypothetical protein